MYINNCKDRDTLMSNFTYPLDKTKFTSEMIRYISKENAKEALEE